jgi:heterodisulfide reductase subunit A
VVLSVGIRPSNAGPELAERLGISCGETGFIASENDAVNTVSTLRPGIYVAGTATAPRDIPDSVASGQAAAMRAWIEALRQGA